MLDRPESDFTINRLQMKARRILPGLVALFCLYAPPAEACSCIGPVGRFLYSNGVEVPLNARGVPWAGTLGWENERYVAPPAGRFLVERLVRGSWLPVPFDLEVIQDSLVTHREPQGDDGLVLVVPRTHWRAQDRFRFTFLQPGMPDTLANRLEVRVSGESLKASRRRLVITKGAEKTTPLRVSTLSGSCSTEIRANQVELQLELTPKLKRWSSILLFSTRVGDLWRPGTDLCNLTPPGRSWKGLARDLVYAECPSGSHFDSAQYVLAAGHHLVTMTAWLPGTEARFTGETEVVLQCK